MRERPRPESNRDIKAIIAVNQDEILIRRSMHGFKVGDFAKYIGSEVPVLGDAIKDAMDVAPSEDAARRLEETAYLVYETMKDLQTLAPNEDSF